MTAPADAETVAALERRHDPARVVALSDGVFAIIITLLVLDVHVPELSAGQSLPAALAEVWPSFTAFAISFIVAGMYWVGHRDVFALIRRTDRGLVWLNLLYLLPACLLPFASALLGRYDREPVAVRVYGLVLVAVACMRLAMWLYATSHPHLLWRRPGPRVRRIGALIAALPGIVYLAALLLAASAPAVSMAIYGIMPLLYFLGVTLDGRRRRQDLADFT